MTALPASQTISSEIKKLKKRKNALILAHYYQDPDIQDVADMVGDSLQMAQFAATSTADILVVAGVFFMAETAKILNPSRKVLLPDLMAGCSLADSCPPDKFSAFIEQHPGSPVVTYINCSAEIKAMSDVVCTSSNAVTIIKSIKTEKPIIFAPDINLGKYLIQQTGRDLLLWNGSCMVHENFSIDKILELHRTNPKARFIAHPESPPHILKVASYIGSTKGMIDFVRQNQCDEFIVATEAGILHQMHKEVPDKTLIPAPGYEDNTCACSECPYMKMNTMEKLYQSLLLEQPTVHVDEAVRLKAAQALARMLTLS
ncbi:quinolinate synthase NadA [Chryseolinea sp. H1M3-3]|uniref:quinolinate synthase NadA n=1 Tax=Chryseolinea sp. H1M3-3 TaxID=3034144 RepID=UPI0023EC07CE|nr:quinolinate synthase NadA [Chryseolinea sp. H1M3-3]